MFLKRSCVHARVRTRKTLKNLLSNVSNVSIWSKQVISLRVIFLSLRVISVSLRDRNVSLRVIEIKRRSGGSSKMTATLFS